MTTIITIVIIIVITITMTIIITTMIITITTIIITNSPTQSEMRLRQYLIRWPAPGQQQPVSEYKEQTFLFQQLLSMVLLLKHIFFSNI